MSPSSSRSREISAIRSMRLLGVHARRRLVEEQELRVGRERPRDLEPALVAVREVAAQLVALALQAHEGEQLLGPRSSASSSSCCMPLRVEQGVDEVAACSLGCMPDQHVLDRPSCS